MRRPPELDRPSRIAPCVRALTVGWTVVGLACTPRLELDARARVTCSAADTACPEGWRCDTTAGRCVMVTPLAGDVTLSQKTIGPAGIDLEVVASEPLAAPPEVALVPVDGGFAPLQVTWVDSPSSQTYRYRYVPEGAVLPDGTVVETRVEMTSATGTQSLAWSTRATFDLRAPAIVADQTRLDLTPPAGAPVETVTTLGLGGRATLRLTFDEHIVSDGTGHPRVSLTTGEVFTLVRQEERTFTFQLDVVEGEGNGDEGAWAQGPAHIEVVTRDAAGNVGVEVLPAPFTLTIDTVAPPAPNVLGGIVLERKPWGDATGSEPSVWLRAAPGTLEPGVTVRVTGPSGTALATLTADATGALERTPLETGDLSHVRLQAIDSAGARSAEVEVLDVEWTVPGRSEVTGSTSEPPAVLLSRAVFDERRDVPGDTAFEAAAVETKGSGRFIPLDDGTRYEGVTSPGVAWSPALNAVFLVGGDREEAVDSWQRTTQPSPRVWRRDRRRWTEVTLTDPEGDSGPARVGNLFVYDEPSAALLLVEPTSGTTWEMTGASWRRVGQQANLLVAAGSVTYDADLGRSLLLLSNGTEAALYTWAPDERRWQPCGSPCGAPLPVVPQAGFQLVHNANQHVLHLYDRGVLYERSATGVWREACGDVCVPAPAPRSDVALGVDPDTGRTLLYGGCGEASAQQGCVNTYFDLWAFDPTRGSWASLDAQANVGTYSMWLGGVAPPAGVPPHGPGARFVHEPAYGLELVGGRGLGLTDSGEGEGFEPSRELIPTGSWRWDRRWIETSPVAPAEHGDLVSYSIDGQAGILYVADRATWRFEDDRWQLVCQECGPPSKRNHKLWFDEVRGKVGLYGGWDGAARRCEVWEWEPQEGWSRRGDECTEAGPDPLNANFPYSDGRLLERPNVAYHPGLGAALDASRCRVWKDDAWEDLDGTCLGPGIATLGQTVWYPQRGALLAYGGEVDEGGESTGQCTVSTMRVFSPGDPEVAPWSRWSTWQGNLDAPPRSSGLLAYDPWRQAPLYFAGRETNFSCWSGASELTCEGRLFSGGELGQGQWPGQGCSDLREILADGSTLVPPVAPGARPGDRVEPIGAALSDRQGLLITGGSDPAPWLWQSPAVTRPAHVMKVSTGAATTETRELRGLSFRWAGGASVHPANGPRPGARLWLWGPRGWWSLAEVLEASPDAMTEVTFDSATLPALASLPPGALDRFAAGADGTIVWAVTPRDGTTVAPHLPTLRTEAMELVVRYRRTRP